MRPPNGDAGNVLGRRSSPRAAASPPAAISCQRSCHRGSIGVAMAHLHAHMKQRAARDRAARPCARSTGRPPPHVQCFTEQTFQLPSLSPASVRHKPKLARLVPSRGSIGSNRARASCSALPASPSPAVVCRVTASAASLRHPLPGEIGLAPACREEFVDAPAFSHRDRPASHARCHGARAPGL